MKSNHKLYSSILRCTICLFSAIYSISLFAQQKDAAEDYNVDSTLYAYYLRCKTEVTSPIIKQMTDTLFQMAGAKRDTRMQAVALTTQLDYFYYENLHEDSIRLHVDIVKQFAKETNQPKYYYFAWSKRLINYYIKHHQYNIAFYEAENMMKEAEQEEYPAGMANGYNILSTIYQAKKLYKFAAENKEKEIEIILKYDIDAFNLSNCYSTLADHYCYLKQTEKAEKCLKKSKELLYSNTQEFYLYLQYCNYYLTLKDYPKAQEYLQKIKKLIDTQKEVAKLAYQYYIAERDYYIAIQEYSTALSIQDYIQDKYSSTISGIVNMQVRAVIYNGLGNLEKAVEYYQKYIEFSDSLSRSNEDITASEFSAIMGVERLNVEKSELQQEVQKRDLANKTRIIVFLVVLLFLCIIIFYREHLLNSKLRSSEKQLSAKNRALLVSETNLLQAKEIAEKASMMKTEFIQSMSHEIRTPLNSIVGFSQIISSLNEKDEETKEYANIIEQGSNNLLQLVDDVLDLASLDSGTNIPMNTRTDLSALCKECMIRAKRYLKPEIVISLQAEEDEFFMQTNPQRLMQILWHLLRNAIKFTQKGQIILEWHTDKDKNHIVFSITDTGIGIPIDKQSFVFERFTKLDTFVQGTGLGLPIGRICAEKMGGSLTLDASYTNGCRFILTLPLIEKKT